VPAARRGDVTVEQLPLPQKQHAEPAYEEFQAAWDKATAEAEAKGEHPKLLRVRGDAGARAAGAAPTYNPPTRLERPPRAAGGAAPPPARAPGARPRRLGRRRAARGLGRRNPPAKGARAPRDHTPPLNRP
jgi:hypothetical protein